MLAELNDNTFVDIEIQIDPFKFSDERCLYYWSKLYNKDFKKGTDYKELNKTICIWIVDGEIYKQFEHFHSKWHVTEEKAGYIENRFDNFEIHIIKLKKFRNYAKIKPRKKEFWLWFIDHTNKELVEMAKSNDMSIEEAYEVYKKITSDTQLMHQILNIEMYERDQVAMRNRAIEEGLKEGMEKGMERGIKQGMKQGKIEDARKMLKLNIPLEQIVEITGLTKEEIEKLKQ